MNRNTILAFILILCTISFFTSTFYNQKILKQPPPSSVQTQKPAEHGSSPEIAQKPAPAAMIAQARGKEEFAEAKTMAPSLTGDTLAAPPAVIVYDTIWVETEKMIIGISELGARIISIKTKDYRVDAIGDDKSLEENPYIEILNDRAVGVANLSINSESLDLALFAYDGENKSIKVGAGDSVEVAFSMNTADGEKIEKKFIFAGLGYIIGVDIHSSALNGKKIGLGWMSGIAESETFTGQSGQYSARKIHLFDSKNVSHITEKKPAKSEESGYYKWVGLTSKYFLVAFICDTARDADVEIEAVEVLGKETDDNAKKKATEIDYKFTVKRFAQSDKESYSIYAGPSNYTELTQQGIKLEKVMFSGWKWFLRADIWFAVMCEFVLWLLIFLQKWLHDYGLVIIALTILSRLITYPLTQSSTKSMSRMRDLQPKVNEIREKHKGNPQKMNQKMMEMYKQEGVNPLNPGCLPMFLQMPVFIALFIVLQKAIELRGVGTWLIPWVHDLSMPEALPIPGLNPLPFAIPLYGSNVALLPIIMAILTYFQNKATIKDPNQKMMIYFMPVFMLVLFNAFPAGLVLYWTFSSALGLIQQYFTDLKKKPSGKVAAVPAAVRKR